MRVVFGVCGLEEEAWAESTQCGRNSGTHCTADELYKFGQVITALFLSFTQPCAFCGSCRPCATCRGHRINSSRPNGAYLGPFCIGKVGITSALPASPGCCECGCEKSNGVFQLSFTHDPDTDFFTLFFTSPVAKIGLNFNYSPLYWEHNRRIKYVFLAVNTLPYTHTQTYWNSLVWDYYTSEGSSRDGWERPCPGKCTKLGGESPQPSSL